MPIVRGQNNTAAGIAERARRRQRAAAGHAGRLQRHHAVVPDPDQRRQLRHARPGRRSRSTTPTSPTAINGIAGLRRHRHVDRRRQHRLHADVRRRVGRHRRPGGLDRQLHRRLHLDRPRDGQGRHRRCRRWPAGATRRRRHGHRRRLHADVRRRRTGLGLRPVHARRPHGADGHRHRDRQGRRGHPAGRRHGRRRRLRRPGTFNDDRLPGHFGGTLARRRRPAARRSRSPARTGFVGETAHGGPVQNKGFIITDTGNHAPDVTTAGAATRSRRGRRSR